MQPLFIGPSLNGVNTVCLNVFQNMYLAAMKVSSHIAMEDLPPSDFRVIVCGLHESLERQTLAPTDIFQEYEQERFPLFLGIC